MVGALMGSSETGVVLHDILDQSMTAPCRVLVSQDLVIDRTLLRLKMIEND